MSAWGGPFGGAIDKIVALEARVKELQEHFDGCAGAEATINDWRQRAVKAEARYLALLKTSLEKLRFDETRRAEAAEARVKELEAELAASKPPGR